MNMKKKILEMVDNKLTIGYVNKFLRRKGIATSERGENALTFKLYDLNWDMLCEDGRLSMRVTFNLGDNIHVKSMMKAINTLNNERYVVKVFLDEVIPQDEEGNPIKDAPKHTDIIFSFENFCYAESAFDNLYEFAIYAMADAISYHKQLYNNYETECIAQNGMPKIGFHSSTEQQEATSVAMDKGERRRIGFV